MEGATKGWREFAQKDKISTGKFCKDCLVMEKDEGLSDPTYSSTTSTLPFSFFFSETLMGSK